jgi:hypothetical protein
MAVLGRRGICGLILRSENQDCKFDRLAALSLEGT